MALDDLVNVTITTTTSPPSRVGFGTPMFFHYTTAFSERIRRFGNTADMLSTNGGPFASTDPAVAFASRQFAQNPTVTEIIIGRADGAPLMTRILSFNGQASTAYTLTLSDGTNTEDFTYTTAASPAGASFEEDIADNLPGLIDAGSVFVKATQIGGATGTTFSIEKADGPGGTPEAGDLFTISVADRSLTMQQDDTDMPITGAGAGPWDVLSDVTRISGDADGSDDWYAMHMALPSDTMITTGTTGAADTIEGLTKILVIDSANDNLLSTTSGNLSETLKDGSYTKTCLSYYATNQSYLGGGWSANVLPLDPGATTWKFKEITGLAASSLSATEIGNLEANNCNYYIDFGRGAITCNGQSSEGEFMDVVRGIAFIETRLQENVYDLLANESQAGRKVAFTDTGIQQVVSEVDGVLKLAASQGIILGDDDPDNPYVITYPRASEVPAADKANRVLPDIEFTATLQGAIHAVTISGTISV